LRKIVKKQHQPVGLPW